MLYALEYHNHETGELTLCEVESNVVYEVGSREVMTRYACELVRDSKKYGWKGYTYRAVPLPWTGELPNYMRD